MAKRRAPARAEEQGAPLELDEGGMRALAGAALDRVVQHLGALERSPMHATRGGKKLAASLRAELPEVGAPAARLLRELFERVVPSGLATASPGYLAYIPGGGLFSAAVADFVALAVNRYAGVWIASPGLVALEQSVLRWFAELVGLPPASGGLLLSGGSMATLVALVAARTAGLPPGELHRGVLYTSDQAHHSVTKAALVAGILAEHVRAIPSDAHLRLSVDALEAALLADRARGLLPFAVVASAGTTNTGAVDPLELVHAVAAREGLWLHVDAAYGGFFILTERGRTALRGIERADSITLDPHKGLFLPYGTGCLLVRDPDTLRRAFSVSASYLPPMQADRDLVDFCELGPELSREARGLRVWFPLALHGAGAFRAALDEKLDLARLAAAELRELPGVELVAEPELSLLAFRHRPAGLTDEAALERHNRALLSGINRRQRVFVTGALVHGRFVVRLCVLSFRTHEAHLRACLADVRAAIDELSPAPRAAP